MQVPKIDGQISGEKHEIKAKKEEEIGNIPLVQKNEGTPPTEDVDWKSLGVNIEKGAIATGEAFEKVLEMNNNPEHLIGPAISPVFTTSSVAQVAASLPSPKPTPEEVTPDENKNLEIMKSCLEDVKGVKDFKRFLKPKTDE